MIDKINAFFKKLNTPFQENDKEELSLEVACTVLLCEVMKADGTLQEEEQISLKAFIAKQFQLQNSQIDEIVNTALTLSDNATDFYQFTRKVNEHYTIEQRMEIVGYLWRLAYIDGELATLEEHIIRKIADLLHLRHSEYIQTKLANTPSS
ncbi:TerB family tellurite resistance protein [Colwellia sp. UCD-KL20]|uniref:tellurite resistance TerB family protein n=1 Tax=Colwellia sp. UCD-KL20 TaxID=1917165 RepID=UPI000970A130|nr:TerB family tellurite resistance protein [Colwellia sp. UCD-KL20]